MNKHLFTKGGLSLERLRTFLEIASAEGISDAAPGDSNRQSQYSRQLKELEEFFGAELIRRGKGRFQLTDAGRELFEVVQSHFNAMEDVVRRSANKSIEIRIGAGESILQWLILPSLPAFFRQHPGISLVFENLRTADICSRLIDGRLDVGVVRHDRVSSRLKSERLGSVEFCVVKERPKSPRNDSFSGWNVLARQPLAVLEDSALTTAIEEEARRRGLNLRICLRGSSYTQLVEAVRVLGCAAILPDFVARSLKDRLDNLVLSTAKPFSRALAIVWNPRSAAMRPAINAVADFFVPPLRDRLDRKRKVELESRCKS